jgi:CRP-like cAMP-binding protein
VTIKDDIAFLGQVPTFPQFSFAALQIVAIGSETKNLADGETLFSAGETTDAGYVIQTGGLTLTTSDLKQSEPPVSFGPGTLIGELALVTETVCSATAVATGPTTVIRISRNLFRKVLEGFPDAAVLMHGRLRARVGQANEELGRITSMLSGEAGRHADTVNTSAGNPDPQNSAVDDPAPGNPPEKPRPWRRRRPAN